MHTSDDVWINAHHPSNPTDPSDAKCEDTGVSCASQGIQILGLSDAPIDIRHYPQVKVEKMTTAGQDECIKYKDNGGGKLESEDCTKDKKIACYAYCGN